MCQYNTLGLILLNYIPTLIGLALFIFVLIKLFRLNNINLSRKFFYLLLILIWFLGLYFLILFLIDSLEGIPYLREHIWKCPGFIDGRPAL